MRNRVSGFGFRVSGRTSSCIRDPKPETRNPKPGGYILFEALMALALLSVGVIAINRAMRETIAVRGMARDYTQARFLLEDLLAKVELQPQLVAAENSGTFGGDLSRFQWTWKVSRIDVPLPEIPADVPPEVRENFKLPASYVTKIEATVSWKRAGRSCEERVETLWPPEKLFIPKEERP